MELHARKLEGSVQSLSASTLNLFGRVCRKAAGRLAAALGVRGTIALAGLLVVMGSVPVAAQTVQFFGAFSSYQQNKATNAQGLVANASGGLYISGFSALVYVPVDANGNPLDVSQQKDIKVGGIPVGGSGTYSTVDAMGLAIDASNNLFRVDPAGPLVQMFIPVGTSNTSFTYKTLGSGWSKPSSVTVDSSGNVYVLDAGTGAIVELTSAGNNTYNPPTTLFTDPALVNTTGLSIDSLGNFYVASGPNYGTYTLNLPEPAVAAVYKITNTSGSYSLASIAGTWVSPSATTADAAGNVWVVDCGAEVDCGAGTINLLVPTGGSSYNQTLYQGIPGIRTLMVNQAGKLYGFGYNQPGDALIWSGGTPPHNLGKYDVGTAAPTVTVTVDFMNAATPGGFNVTTQGASTGDFQFTSGGTCAAGSYSASQSCTVEVTFTPQAPGMRTGALVITDGGGAVLGTNYFYGVGQAPSIAFQPGTFSTPVPNTSGLGTPFGAALDEAGNLYVTDAATTLYQFAGGSTTATWHDSTLQGPLGMTVDGAGNLWVAECSTNNDVVLETLTGPGVYTKSTPISGLACPYDVAVDGSGNVYIAEYTTGDVLKETPNNGSYAQSTVVSGLLGPNGVAVDSSGNIYVTDTGNNQVLEETPAGVNSYTQTIVANSVLIQPEGLAIDPNGNVYISDSGNGRIVEATPSGGTFLPLTVVTRGINLPVGLALDAAGDLYIADESGAAIDELNISTAPTFAFASTAAGSESSDSPKSATLFNYGNATLNISTISIPTGFSSDSTTCALNSETLVANGSCLLGIDFTPTAAGTYSAAVSLADNNLNTLVSQNIGVSGMGVSITVSPASETLSAGTVGVTYTQTFTAGGGTGPYTLALTNGALPTGLNLTNGVLSGTPTASGTFTCSIVATDSSSPAFSSSSQSYSLTINAASIPLTIVPASLPDGALGIPYSQTISASGGDGDYTYAVSAGALPAGLSLNGGLLTGTPTLGGPTAFTVTATDTLAGMTASQSYTPTIYAVASAAPPQAAGSSNIGSLALPITLTFTFNVPAAVASINVVTQGAANHDFLNAGTGSCAQGTYSPTSANTCTVDVNFAPQVAGTRYGAVLLEDGAGNVLGTGYVSGTGTGPQITFQPGTETTVATAASPFNLAAPVGVAVAAGGNLYIADHSNGAVYKEALSGGSYTQSTIATINFVTAVAVDGAGNVYIAQGPNSTLYKETPAGGSSYTQSVISSSVGNSWGIAVDGAGNVFVTDSTGNAIYELTLSAGIYSQSTIVSTGLNHPEGIAVDATGNLYVADANDNVVWTFSAGTYIASKIASGLSSPYGVALDGSGNVYISNYGAGQILKETWSGGAYTQTVVPTGSPTSPYGIAMDASGNLFVADGNNSRVLKEDYADLPSLTFASPTNVGSADTEAAPTVTLVNSGNAPLTFPFPATGSNPAIVNSSFALDNSSSCPQISAGGVAGSLAAGGSCSYAVDFTPQASGANSGTLTVSDNHLNNASAAQSITLSGTGVQPVITVSPLAGTLTPGTVGVAYSQSFTASGGSGPYTFSSTGSLPAGLVFSASGVLSGTPTAAGSLLSFSVTATDTLSGSQVTQGYTLSIAQGAANVTLGGMSQTYTGSALPATATTTPSGLTVVFTYNGSSTVPTVPGTYAVVGTINDLNYTGTATGTMIISKAVGSVTLGGMSQTYTGSPLAATATTTPSSLNVSFTYNGSATLPTAAGEYTVVGTINDANYTGTATGTMTISKAAGSVTLSGMSQVYTGSAVAATAMTNPAHLSVSFTYNGSWVAPTTVGSYAVVGTINDADYAGTGTGTLTISKAAGSVTLGGMSQTYTGSALAVTATTIPAGLNVLFTYNGSSTAPTAAGSYVVVGTINDLNYTGSATGTMTISKTAGSVTLGGLSQTYTGSTLAATATATPASLSVSLTYNGSSTVPTAAGTYAVVGTINDADYTGSATGTMTISKAAATVMLSKLSQTYTGSALTAIATTIPASLSVSLTYNGSSTVPTAAGSYAVVGTINNTNYTGSASGTLIIDTAATAVSVTSSANPVVLMNSLSLTAIVTSAAGTPPGEISFFDGTTLLGSATVSSGVATFTTATLTAGSHSITATYTASVDFAVSSSSVLALSVVDLTVGTTGGSGSTGQSQTTTPGGSASYTVALAPSAGTTFPSAITLSVTGLPVGATATLGTPGWTEQSLTSWSLPANQPVSNISLKFQMPEQMAAVEPSHGSPSKLPLVAVGLLLLPFTRKWRKARSRMNGWLCLMLVTAGITAAIGATGCGSSSTPPQTYNVTVTVTAGTMSHSTQLTLTVK